MDGVLGHLHEVADAVHRVRWLAEDELLRLAVKLGIRGGVAGSGAGPKTARCRAYLCLDPCVEARQTFRTAASANGAESLTRLFSLALVCHEREPHALLLPLIRDGETDTDKQSHSAGRGNEDGHQRRGSHVLNDARLPCCLALDDSTTAGTAASATKPKDAVRRVSKRLEACALRRLQTGVCASDGNVGVRWRERRIAPVNVYRVV